jgi:hypothetical protein
MTRPGPNPWKQTGPGGRSGKTYLFEPVGHGSSRLRAPRSVALPQEDHRSLEFAFGAGELRMFTDVVFSFRVVGCTGLSA